MGGIGGVRYLRENVFVDKQSGKDFDRPAYNELIAWLSENDTLVVKCLHRLVRMESLPHFAGNTWLFREEIIMYFFVRSH